ncbi:hypothetical protein BDF19DRAFT_436406 [Syncephalis fuscata]|nr:hypothetical protein BDF19DRAFT_436406 [Syncephalis fuscata]
MRSQNIDSLFNEPNIYQNDRISGATVPKSPISNMKQYWHKRQHPSIDRYYFEQDKERVIPGVSFDNNMEFGSNSNNNSSTMYQTLQSNPQFTVKGLEITKPFTDKKDKQRRSPIKRCKSNDSWVLEQEEYSADDSMPYGSFIGTNKALQQKSTENNDLKEIKNENNCTLRNLPVIDKDELWSDQEPEPGWSSTSHIEAWQTKIDEAENNEQSLWLSEVTVNRRSKSRKTLNTSNTSLSTTTAHSLDPRSIMVNFNYDLDYSLASSDGNEDSCNDSTTNQEDTPIVTPETYTSINPDGSLTSKSCQPDQERETFDFLFY